MPVGRQLGLDPGNIVLNGDPAPSPKRGTTPNFRPMSVMAKRLDGLRCHLVGKYSLSQCDIVLKGGPSSPPPPEKRGIAPNFRLMSVVAKRLDGSRGHLIRRYAG